jgi:hypothetical protein
MNSFKSKWMDWPEKESTKRLEDTSSKNNTFVSIVSSSNNAFLIKKKNFIGDKQDLIDPVVIDIENQGTDKTDKTVPLEAEHKAKGKKLFSPAGKAESIGDGYEIIRQSPLMVWFKDPDGRQFRYFPGLDKVFKIEVAKPGDPATCTNCGNTFERLPSPALIDRCPKCQPSSIGWIPDTGESRWEGDLEFRTGPVCYACGSRDRWRKGKSRPLICRVCHPPA